MATWDDYNKSLGGAPASPALKKTPAPKISPTKSWDAFNASASGTSMPREQEAKISVLEQESAVATEKAKKAEKTASFFGKFVGAPERAIFGPQEPVKVKGVKVPTSVAEVVNLPFEAVNAAEKAVGAGVQYGAQKIFGGPNKSFKELYEKAPTIGGVISEELGKITEKARERTGQTMTTMDYFLPEFFGVLSDAGVTAAILAPLGSRISTKYKTEIISPEQMADVVTGRTPKGAPLKPETIDLIKREVMAPENTKQIIKEAVKNGVEIKTAGPAGPIRQIVGEFVGGRAPEEGQTKVTVGGRPVEKGPVSPAQQMLPPSSWDDFNKATVQAPDEVAHGRKNELAQALSEEWDNNYADAYGELYNKYEELRQIKNPTPAQMEEMANTAVEMFDMEDNFVSKYKTSETAADVYLTTEEIKAKGLPEATPSGIPIQYRRGGTQTEKATYRSKDIEDAITKWENELESAGIKPSETLTADFGGDVGSIVKQKINEPSYANQPVEAAVFDILNKHFGEELPFKTATKDLSIEAKKYSTLEEFIKKTGAEGEINYRELGDWASIAENSKNVTEFQNSIIKENLDSIKGFSQRRDTKLSDAELEQNAKKVIKNTFAKRTGMSFEEFFNNVKADKNGGKSKAELTEIYNQATRSKRKESLFQKIGQAQKEKQTVPREQYLKKQIDKQIDAYRRGADIMPTTEGAGVRGKAVFNEQSGEFKRYVGTFKLSRAKSDMARRSRQSKTYAMQELMANDENFAKMVHEYEDILASKKPSAPEPEMVPTFKRAPARRGGFLASIGKKKSVEGMIEGRQKAAAKEGGFILSQKAKEIIKEFGTPVAEKTLSKRLLGVFKPLSENVRVQSLHDLTTVVHEATHAIDHKNGITKQLMEVTGISRNGNPIYSKATAPIRKTLTDIYVEMYGDPGLVSKRQHDLPTRMKEGLATFIENYFYNPAGMLEKYPTLVKEFIQKDGKYHNADIEKLLERMNSLVDEYAQLSPDERIGARIRRGDEVVKKDSGFNFAQRAEFEIFNRFEPLKRYSRQAGVSGTWDDPTVQAFNWMNKNAFVADFYSGEKIPIIQKDGNFKFEKGNVEDYVKLTKGREKEFDTFLTARRVIANHDKYNLAKDEWFSVKEDYENMKRVQSEGYAIDRKALEQLQEVKNEYERWGSILEKDDFRLQDATATVEKYADEFKNASEIYDGVNKHLIDWSENTGLIDKEAADKYRNDTGYASWKRFIDDEISGKSVGTMSGTKGKVSSFKERTGSDLDIISPVYNQLVAINEIVGKGLENKIWERVYNLSKKSPEIARRFEEIEAQPTVDKEGRVSFPQERDPNLIRVLIDGQKKFFKPAPEFLAVVKNLKPNEFTPFDLFLHIPASIFTRLTTSANPVWSLGNITVDQFSALAQTKTGFKPVIDPMKSLKDYVTGDELVKEYVALGGKRQNLASFYHVAPEEIPTKLFKQFGGMNKKQKAVSLAGKIVDTPLNFLEMPANISELLTRYSEYRRAIDAGDNMSVSMYKASEVTIPFQLQGNFWGQGMRKYIKAIPYFNAALQAIYKFGRSAKTNPGRVASVGAGIMATALTTAIATMVVASDKQKRLLSEQPARLLARYLYIPSPNGEDLIRLRVPEQFGAITGMVYLWTISHYGGNEASFKEYLDSMMSALPDQINIAEPKKMVLSWLPQAIKPSVEVITNTKTFPDVRPIVPDYMKYKKPSERYTTYTSNVGKLLGQMTNSSPAMIDFWIREQFGAAGGMLVGKMPGIPTYLQEKDYVLTGRAYNNFYDQKEMIEYQYNLIRDFEKGKTSKDPMFSEKEVGEIKTRRKLNEDVADTLADMRKLAQSKNFNLPEELRATAYELLKDIDKNSTNKSYELLLRLRDGVNK